jgi:hypothetical protein
MTEDDVRDLLARIGRFAGKDPRDLTADDLEVWKAVETARFDQLEAAYREGESSGRWERYDAVSAEWEAIHG